jgi:hypothetical protein
MAAKDYKLCVSALTGTVYISKISNRNRNEMTDDRIEVQQSEFIKAMVEWIDSREKNKDGILTITAGGKPILEIKQL